MPADPRRLVCQNVGIDADPQGSAVSDRFLDHDNSSFPTRGQVNGFHGLPTAVNSVWLPARPRDPKILLLSQIIPPVIGGSGRYFWEIVRRMAPENVLVMSDTTAGAAEFDATHGVRVIRTPMAFPETGIASRRGLADYLSLARHVRDVCLRNQIDYVWCGRCVPEGWIGWLVRRMTGVPYFVSAHGEEVTLPQPGDTAGVMTSRQHRWMARRVFSRAAGVIANSENTRNIIRTSWNVPDERLYRLTPGVDTDVFRPASRCPATRAALGWTDRTVLLTVGRLQKRKGHELMIAALDRVRTRVPDVLYAVFGDGPERDRLSALVDQLDLHGHVRFYGEADNAALLRAYQQSDVFVLPNCQIGSEIEGFGMVLLEAQACGKPVVAGASGGTVETMRVADTGFLVDCTEPAALAHATATLLADAGLRDRMGAAAREWVLRQFEWSSLVRQFDGLVGRMPRSGAYGKLRPVAAS